MANINFYDVLTINGSGLKEWLPSVRSASTTATNTTATINFNGRDNSALYRAELPLSSDTQAGIITADMYNKIMQGAVDNQAILVGEDDQTRFSFLNISGVTNIQLAVGNYSIITENEKVSATTTVTYTKPFEANKLLLINTETFGVSTDVDEVFMFADTLPTEPEWKVVASTFNQTKSYQVIHINGYGNLENTPAQLYNRIVAQLIGTPANCTITLSDGNLQISGGAYRFLNTQTSQALPYTITETTIPYSFNSVIYLDLSTLAVGATDVAALPVNCYIIGSMNTINNTSTVYINGIGKITE